MCLKTTKNIYLLQQCPKGRNQPKTIPGPIRSFNKIEYSTTAVDSEILKEKHKNLTTLYPSIKILDRVNIQCLIIYKKKLFFSEKCRKTKVNCRNKIDSITHLFFLHIYQHSTYKINIFSILFTFYRKNVNFLSNSFLKNNCQSVQFLQVKQNIKVIYRNVL